MTTEYIPNQDEECGVSFSEIWAATNKGSLNPDAQPFISIRSIRTKLKWVSQFDPDTYRVAIITYKGVLQVKSVTNGWGECDTSYTLGGTYPLIKKLFPSEEVWRASLPVGSITVTEPMLPKWIVDISTKPLSATTDPLKMKELEERFPGEVFVVTNGKMSSMNINYYSCIIDDYLVHLITDSVNKKYYSSFGAMGITGSPEIMVRFRGYILYLDHLF